MTDMRIIIIFIPILFLLTLSCDDEPTHAPAVDNRDILQKIQSVPDLQVTEIPPQNGYDRQFEIYINFSGYEKLIPKYGILA